MKKTTPLIPILATLLGLTVCSQPQAGNFQLQDADADLGEFIEGPKWKEDELGPLPAWPDDDKLLPLQVDSVDAPFLYYLDPASLSIGKDGISRYTIVIESTSGVRNVIYEGIRCRTRESRVYAYGTSDNTFSPATVSQWEPIRIHSSGTMVHRFNLHQYYLCDPLNNPRDVDAVIQEVRYPKTFKSSGLYLN